MKLKELYEQEERSILSVMSQQSEKISGNFSCYNNQLTSLEGAPKEVGRDFYCSFNQLTSLEGCPQKVGGNFYCHSNNLTSLEGCPQEVGEHFSCSNNQLTSLEGCPQKVGGDFYCSSNQLTNLKDIHKHIKSISGDADFLGNPIKSHVVGLLLIEGLVHVNLDNKKVRDILNKHLQSNKDVLACIDELEEAGFPEFAKI